MRLIYTSLCIVMLCAGCVSKPHETEPAEPVGGLKQANARPEYSSEQLMQLYLANITFGDWYLARLSAACDQLAQTARTPDARYEALQLKAAQAASVYSILTNPNPTVQVLSLQVLIELTRIKWMDEGKAQAVFSDRGKLLGDALDEMQQRGRANALAVISESELNAIAESARRWRSANREISDIEFIRFEDFATELAHSLAQQKEGGNFMAALQSTASDVSESRQLGQRALYLMSRFPRIMQWQLEAQMADVTRRPEAQRFLDDMSRITRTAEEVRVQATQMQASLDRFPQKLADSLTGESTVKDAISTANRAIKRGDAATTQLSAVESSVRELDTSVANLSGQIDRLNQAYSPPSVQKMVGEGKLVAAREARSLIYLITGCAAALVVLHALLRPRRRPAPGIEHHWG